MNVLIAPNAFKGTVSARRAADILARAVRRAEPTARVRVLPLADGGDGTLDALSDRPGAVRRWATVRGPRGRRVRAPWLWFAGARRAVVEMARASGLALLRSGGRDPERTTSHGTGQLIDAARRAGAKEIWVGLGGTATVDGGAGLLQAMGLDLDRDGVRLTAPAVGGDLGRMTRINAGKFRRRWAGVRFTLLTDVRNRLNGARGAARVFGPQKGADKVQVARLARGLQKWGDALVRAGGRNPRRLVGGGAAGGAAAGLWSLTRARVAPGARWLADAAGLRAAVAWADWIVTGEGGVDATSFEGKLTGEILRLARRRKIPATVVAGSATPAAAGRIRRWGARLCLLGPAPRNSAARRMISRTRGLVPPKEIR